MNNIINKFPKIKTILPSEYKKIYLGHYINNRTGNYKSTSISNKLESWMHKKISEEKNYKSTLEIGAGNLNHLKYYKNSLIYDIVEPEKKFYQSSLEIKKIRNFYTELNEIDYSKNKYDRIISVATFEHILNLPELIYKTTKLLKTNGHLKIAIPSEGTILWRIGTMITGYEFKRRYNLNYQIIMKHEHVNTAKEIEDVLNYYYNDIKCNVFGLSKKLSLYRYYDCKNPKKIN